MAQTQSVVTAVMRGPVIPIAPRQVATIVSLFTTVAGNSPDRRSVITIVLVSRGGKSPASTDASSEMPPSEELTSSNQRVF
ncbi:MAG: hypothetical protein WBD20_24420 [Pirellulaceae bacterium]